MKKILITGADGFIGSHLVEALVKKKYKVKAFIYYNAFNSFGWIDQIDKEIKKKIEIISGDIRDINILKSSVKNCDTIIHLAALIGIPYSYNSPKSYVDVNVQGTLNLLQVAKDYKIKKFIHTSTSEVYGTPEYLPIDETHPLNAQSPYAASKIAADQLALSFYKSFQTPVSIIRPFNTFGPRQSARAIIPTIILQILTGSKKIKLGNIYSTRDLSFIDDTIEGFSSMLKKDVYGEIVNLGNGFDISIKELVKVIAQEMSVKIEIVTDKRRVRPKQSEVEKLRSNNSKAKKILNWRPKYLNKKGLIKGISKTIEWFDDKENLRNYKSEIYNI